MILFKFNNKKEVFVFIMGFIPLIIIGGVAAYILLNPILDDLKASVTKYVIMAVLVSFVLLLLIILFKLKQMKKIMTSIIVLHLIFGALSLYALDLYVRTSNALNDALTQQSTANFYLVALKDKGITPESLAGKTLATMDDAFWGDINVKQIMAEHKKTPVDYNAFTVKYIINYIEASEMLENGSADLILIDNSGLSKIEAVNPEFIKKIEKVATFSYDIALVPGADLDISQEPFTVLLAGLDNRVLDGEDDINSGRTDAIIMATFNPKTMRVLMVSIPRDTFLPIPCQFNYKDKINAAGMTGGIGCTIDALQNAFDVPIDYFVVVNFDAVVAAVDAMGGIEVDVPISFCEQNSVGAYGNNQICLEPGVQTLNGQQALALARHRKTVDDIIRGKNQMLIIQAVVTKFAQNASNMSLPELLPIVEGNFKTNFGQQQFGQFMTLARNIGFESMFSPTSSLLMEKMTLLTYGETVNEASVQIPMYDSITEITNAINQVSGREPFLPPTEFAFDPNVPIN